MNSRSNTPASRSLLSALAAMGILVASVAIAGPASAAKPAPADDSWTLLAAGERASIVAPTTGNDTTTHRGSEWYYNAFNSIGFAPAGAAIDLGSADVAASSFNTPDETTPYRLSWHTNGTSIFGGWRVGEFDNLNGSADFERAIYEANVEPGYYPTGPQRMVAPAALVGWTECWSGAYNETSALADVFTACDGAYLLYAGRSRITSIDVLRGGSSILEPDTGDQESDVLHGDQLRFEVLEGNGDEILWDDFIVFTSLCDDEGCADSTPRSEPSDWNSGVSSDDSYVVPESAAGRTLVIYAADDVSGEPDPASQATIFVQPAAAELAETGPSVLPLGAAGAATLLLGALAFALAARTRRTRTS